MDRIRFTKSELNKMLGRIHDGPKPIFRYYTDQTGMTVSVRSTAKGSTVLYLFKKRHKGKLFVKSIGNYPELSLDRARYEFNRLAGVLMQTGSLDSEVTMTEPEVMTFGALIQEFLEFKKQKIQPKTYDNYVFYSTPFEVCAEQPINKITASLLKEAVFDKIANRPGLYNQARTFAKALGQYAYAKDYLPSNPFAKLTMLVDTQKTAHHATFADDEMKERMTALFDAISQESLLNQALIHFHFYVPLRNSEVRSLTRAQVANNATEVTVKTKTWDNFTMPLNSQAQRLINYLLKEGDNGYLLHSSRSLCSLVSMSQANKILRRCGIEDFVIHSTRSCAMQFLVKQTDVKETVASMCLAHKIGNKTEQAYNRGEYLQERRYAMQLWGDFVEECVGKNAFY